MDSTYPYIASLTREGFLFYEMKVTAGLLIQGLTGKEAIEKVFKENLYQYPTEKSLKGMARCCVKRLKGLENEYLVKELATGSQDVAKQICLYAMMRQSRLLWEFMTTVIGEKYRTFDYSYSRMELNSYFTRLQEQDETVGSWSENTIKALKSVFNRVLVENGYIDNYKSEKLNKVLLDENLKKTILENGDSRCLPAFNCFEQEEI